MLRAVNGLDRVRLRLDRVRAAVGEIDPVFLDTPALPCAPLGEALGCSVTLKVETLNPVRSFKGRGTETVAGRGPRAGRVARGVRERREPRAGAGLQRRAPGPGRHRRGGETANPLKLRQIAAFGADVRLEGEDIEDARLLAREIAEADGAYLVEDSLDLATCEGAATIGLELVRDDPALDVVLVALGGGAMASGVGYVVRSLAEHVEVIGIQPVGAPAMALSWRQRTVVETDRIDTIADGVAGRCPIPEVLDDLLVVLDDVVLVREDSIKVGMRRSTSTRGSSSSRPRRSGSPPSSRSPSGSPGGASPRSCAEATSDPPTSRAGCWNRPRASWTRTRRPLARRCDQPPIVAGMPRRTSSSRSR